MNSIIIKPIISEKSSILNLSNKYVFKVNSNSNKIEIKKAIEELFNVKVIYVNTISVPAKKKRLGKYEGIKSAWKKAVVTLHKDYKIENFEKLS